MDERRRVAGSTPYSQGVRGPSQRHALGLLFTALTLGFAGVALGAAAAGVWVVTVAAAALALWLATLAAQALRRR